MGYYHRVYRPCNGYHELFFNRLLYVLYRVVGNNIENLARNMGLFDSFYFQVRVISNRYTYDLLSIEPNADNNMQYIQFGEKNANIANGLKNNANWVKNKTNDSKGDANDSEMGRD